MVQSGLKSLIAATLLLTSPLSAQAAEPGAARPIVVELFTSQGCSSCPPADAYLQELAKRDDVLALSFPVNIWDYLGWQDTLAAPANVERQRGYVARLGGRSVYTPQMVIDGVEDAVGSRIGHVERAIELRAETKTDDVPITFASDADTLQLTVGASSKRRNATLWLVRYTDATSVSIEAGENRGRSITYANVVREMVPIAMWHGEEVSLELPKVALMSQGYDGCAAILQEDGFGPIFGVARLDMDAL